MGFGLLMMGYFLAFLVSNFHAGFAFAGGYLMMLGLLKLKDYNSSFTKAIYPLGAFMALALKDSVLDLLSLFSATPRFFEYQAVRLAFEYLDIASVALFNLLLFFAISELASEVKDEKIRVSALRNMYFFAAYVILCAVRYLPIPYGNTVLRYFNLTLQLMQLFWIASAMIMLFSCYRNIVDKNQLEKELAEESDNNDKKAR